MRVLSECYSYISKRLTLRETKHNKCRATQEKVWKMKEKAVNKMVRSTQGRQSCAETKMAVKTFQRLQHFLGLQRGAGRLKGTVRGIKGRAGSAGTAGRTLAEGL